MNFRLARPLGLTLLLVSSAVSAANMAFMVDQAMSRFSTQDAELFNAAVAQALKSKDATEIRWNNPATGAFGTVTPYADPQQNPDCRELHMVNVAENVKSGGYYRFCKRTDGSWQPAVGTQR